MRLISKHPLFLVGFRPMFSLAMLAAIVMPLTWALVFAGKISLPHGATPLTWHAHEMFYGFGWAVMGGFLLTASKNWVKVRGLHGTPLLILALLWLFERYLMLNPDLFQASAMVRIFFLNAYMAGVSTYVLWSLWIHRKNDSYSDNFFFFFALITFFVAKNSLLSPSSTGEGLSMTLGLFRLAFAVMFERTLTQFMKLTEQTELYRHPALDYLIKSLVFASVFESFFEASLAGGLLIFSGLLLFTRWILWKPQIGFRKISNATMYIGYLGVVLNMILEGLHRWGHTIGTPTTGLHLFAFLSMGVVISGMFIRICQGHTGRKPQFTTADKVAIYSMLVAAIFRLGLPLIWPELYPSWILVAASLWSLCFLLLSLRLMPFLVMPRIDGKEH